MQIRNVEIDLGRTQVDTDLQSVEDVVEELQRLTEINDQRFRDMYNLMEKLALPEYTATERAAITASNGQMIYNSTDNRIEIYQNGAWRYITNVSNV